MNKIHLYLFLVIISGLITYTSQNLIITDDLIIEHLGSQMSFDRIGQMLDFRDQWAWINYAILPIIYLLKFIFITLWVLSGSILFGYKSSFKQIFQVVIVAEFVWLIPSFLMIIWFGFIDTNYTFVDVQYFQPLSLLNIFDVGSLDSWLVFPLKSLNLFEITYMVVLALGLRKVLKKDFNSSLSFTVPVYGSGLITWIIFITFLSINLSA